MISRQRKCQIKQQKLGNCVICGKKRGKSNQWCDRHLKQRTKNHKEYAIKNKLKYNGYQKNWIKKKRKVEKENNRIYLFSPDITYERFYNVWKKFPPEGITPECMIKGKLIWQMIRDKQIYVYLDETQKDDPVILALKLPKRKILMLS